MPRSGLFVSDKFTFDGRLMSKSEIARALGMDESTVRKHLKAGRYTRKEIMAYEPKRAQRAGGRRGATAARKTQTRRGNGEQRDY